MALEEPLSAGDWAGLNRVAEATNVPVILDETVSRQEHLDLLLPRRAAGSSIAGCRKWVGCCDPRLQRSAQSRGLGIIVGAHVGETSVLTRAALTLAAATRGALVAQEGAFGTHCWPMTWPTHP